MLSSWRPTGEKSEGGLKGIQSSSTSFCFPVLHGLCVLVSRPLRLKGRPFFFCFPSSRCTSKRQKNNLLSSSLVLSPYLSSALEQIRLFSWPSEQLMSSHGPLESVETSLAENIAENIHSLFLFWAVFLLSAVETHAQLLFVFTQTLEQSVSHHGKSLS